MESPMRAYLRVRLRASERELVTSAAKRQASSVSAFVRRVVLEAARRVWEAAS